MPTMGAREATRRRKRKGSTIAVRRPRVEAAFRELLVALGYGPDGTLERTPRRTAELWLEHLIAGEHADVSQLFARAVPTRSASPVVLRGLGVHLVCPHHLTVALGHASLAYVPKGRIAGFGSVTRLVEIMSARLALQEDVTRDIAQALVRELGARAAVVSLEAAHPCQAVAHPRAHDARAVTMAHAGDSNTSERLERLLRRAESARS
jgi:GTP cyclohydrolase IA